MTGEQTHRYLPEGQLSGVKDRPFRKDPYSSEKSRCSTHTKAIERNIQKFYLASPDTKVLVMTSRRRRRSPWWRMGPNGALQIKAVRPLRCVRTEHRVRKPDTGLSVKRGQDQLCELDIGHSRH
jgi:hypothetical protein